MTAGNIMESPGRSNEQITSITYLKFEVSFASGVAVGLGVVKREICLVAVGLGVAVGFVVEEPEDEDEPEFSPVLSSKSYGQSTSPSPSMS